MARLPVYFISHGGGPWSYMDDAARAPYAKLAAELADMPRQIGTTPAAVLMISAHWEEPEFTLTAHPKPPMVYDYYGFPDYTYRIRYDAPGDPALAARVKALIEAAGMPARLDPERGFDHGAFTPLNVIYPRADVPVVQLSLMKGLDPATAPGAGPRPCSAAGRGRPDRRQRALVSQPAPILQSPRDGGHRANSTAGCAAFCSRATRTIAPNYWPPGRLLLRHARPIRARSICCRSWSRWARPATMSRSCHITRKIFSADSPSAISGS